MKLPLVLTVNGRRVESPVAPHTSLLTLLRDTLQLTGTKRGCEEGECGACSVLLDGRLVNSCLVLAIEANGATVTTVEGLGAPGWLSPLQEAFAAAGASQCGFCIPGMLLAAASLLEQCPHPDDRQIRQGISGNLCRCTGYDRIVQAIRAAAARRAPQPHSQSSSD
jgi:carbon-monoxide dehydrogenase small subunit